MLCWKSIGVAARSLLETVFHFNNSAHLKWHFYWAHWKFEVNIRVTATNVSTMIFSFSFSFSFTFTLTSFDKIARNATTKNRFTQCVIKHEHILNEIPLIRTYIKCSGMLSSIERRRRRKKKQCQRIKLHYSLLKYIRLTEWK